jgi:hypothetical protein
LLLERGHRLLMNARDIVLAITLARVPMPKSAQAFINRCHVYRESLLSGVVEPQPESMRSPTLGYALTS